MTDDPAYDVIVVGARVAGSLVAILLGQQGRRVLLLDRARFPSDTLSTHFFRAPSLRAFHQAGVGPEVEGSAPHLTVNHNVVDGVAFPEPVDRPDDFPFYLCLRRLVLDDILTRRVQAIPAVEFRQAARVDGLWREGGRVVGVEWVESGERRRARARVVVGADGIRSSVARSVMPQAEHEEPVNRAMYYAYFQGVEPPGAAAAEFHYRGNRLVYCFPCDGGLHLLAASVPIADFTAFRRAPEVRLEEELRAMSDLAPRFEAARREGPVRGTGTIPGYLRVPYGDGWALVGDAGMIMDPWSGQGIDQATTHAVILAGELASFLDGGDWSKAMTAYHRARNEFSRETYRRTCRFGRDLRPMTQAALARRGLGGAEAAG
jgi:2-polyprenyl-6-methoxyphenol hydroxylase-like FAD-dependent oxidoreductase